MNWKSRKFQSELEIKLQDIVESGQFQNLILNVTPGGGKSIAPVLCLYYLRLLYPSVKILWGVPRLNLVFQAEDVFVNPSLRAYLNHDLTIMGCEGNKIDPTRGRDGYSITYQSIFADQDLHVSEFRRSFYILVLDEHQYIGEDLAWMKAITKLHTHPQKLMTMILTGTPERGDGKPIALLPYTNGPLGKILDKNHPDYHWINYSRKQALLDKAVVPIIFSSHEANGEYVRDGKPFTFDQLRGGTCFESYENLKCTLRTEAAFEILDAGVQEYQEFKLSNPWAKCIVVASDINDATRYAERLSKYSGLISQIATSDDSEAAHIAIDRFRGIKTPNIDVLICVAMAHVGMDCPRASHLVYLSQIRSRPWIEQCFARPARMFEGKKFASIHTPNDPKLLEILQQMQEEQESVIREMEKKAATESNGNNVHIFSPLWSQKGIEHVGSLDGSIGSLFVENGYSERISMLEQQLNIPLAKDERVKFAKFLRAAGMPTATTATTQPMRPSELEGMLRRRVSKYVRKTAKIIVGANADQQRTTDQIKEIHYRLKNGIGKPTTLMNADELRQAMQWLHENYPTPTSRP